MMLPQNPADSRLSQVIPPLVTFLIYDLKTDFGLKVIAGPSVQTRDVSIRRAGWWRWRSGAAPRIMMLVCLTSSAQRQHRGSIPSQAGMSALEKSITIWPPLFPGKKVRKRERERDTERGEWREWLSEWAEPSSCALAESW